MDSVWAVADSLVPVVIEEGTITLPIGYTVGVATRRPEGSDTHGDGEAEGRGEVDVLEGVPRGPPGRRDGGDRRGLATGRARGDDQPQPDPQGPKGSGADGPGHGQAEVEGARRDGQATGG